MEELLLKEKLCTTCLKYRALNLFSKDASKKDGLCYRCKKCQSAYETEVRNKRVRIRNNYSPNKAKYLKEYAKKYNLSPLNKQKIEARNITRQAIKFGEIPKKDHCEMCLSKDNIEVHHPDYSKPLEIQWLCKRHHWRADQLLKSS